VTWLAKNLSPLCSCRKLSRLVLLPWLLPAWASGNLADFRIRLFEFSVLNFALEFE
jgi:hypothetical protein